MALTLKTAAFYHNQRGGPWGVNQQANKIQEMMLNSDYNLIGWRRILASQLTVTEQTCSVCRILSTATHPERK
tara:strand:- start:234722 stop:234940 length:219 start_codon:yes stop_codon:yes gene_type:complete